MHVHVCTLYIYKAKFMYMYVNICLFMYMYMLCTYRSILVHNFIYVYIHVCTMYRAVCTDLQILVHVVRIPDDCHMTGIMMSGHGICQVYAVTSCAQK